MRRRRRKGFISPVRWGVEEEVRERFGAAGVAPGEIACERASYVFCPPGPPADILDLFRTYYGPTMNAYEAAAAAGREAQLHEELRALFEAQNQGGAGETVIPATYLNVTVHKR